MTHTHAHSQAHATFALTTMHCTGCADAIERTLRANPHITNVHLDWVKNEVHVGYHDGMIMPAEVERLIAATGCDCTETSDHRHAAHAASPQTRLRQFQVL